MSSLLNVAKDGDSLLHSSHRNETPSHGSENPVRRAIG
jgi:hypothetical protein